ARPGRGQRKRRRSKKAKRGGPLFIAMGIEFTRTVLLAAIVCLVMFGVAIWALFALTPLGGWLSSAPDVQVVDVYTAVNALRYTDVGERMLQSKTVAFTIPGHRKLLVTRESPEGGYLLVKLKVSHQD